MWGEIYKHRMIKRRIKYLQNLYSYLYFFYTKVINHYKWVYTVKELMNITLQSSSKNQPDSHFCQV